MSTWVFFELPASQGTPDKKTAVMECDPFTNTGGNTDSGTINPFWGC